MPNVAHWGTLGHMKNKPQARQPKTATIRVRVPEEVKTWLRRAAAKSNVDMSDIIRPLLMERFMARHAK